MENSVQQRESAKSLKMMVQAPENMALNPKRWTNQLLQFTQLQISATFSSLIVRCLIPEHT